MRAKARALPKAAESTRLVRGDRLVFRDCVQQRLVHVLELSSTIGTSPHRRQTDKVAHAVQLYGVIVCRRAFRSMLVLIKKILLSQSQREYRCKEKAKG